MLVNRQKEILDDCIEYGVLLLTKQTGRHYLLADGNHTIIFFDFAPGFAKAAFRYKIGKEIMEDLGRLGLDHEVDVILTAAIGCIPLAVTVSELFHTNPKPLVFYGEKVNGIMRNRRNFKLLDSQKVLLLDDAYNKGDTMMGLHRVCAEAGSLVVAQAAVVNRNQFGRPTEEDVTAMPTIFLFRYPIAEEFTPDECVSCKRGVPLEKDGILVDNMGNPLISE